MDDFYTDLAHDYEWLFSEETLGGEGEFGATSRGSKDLLEAVLETLAPGARVLDCSCGIGADAIALARRGFTVTASDGSASMIAETRRRSEQFGVGITTLQSRWQDLPQRVPDICELILCLGNSIVHAGAKPDIISALQSIKKILSPDGALVIDSRNWELLYESRPRIVTASHVIERNGVRCSSLYIWTIPDHFGQPCRAEIVLLFEGPSSAVSHRRHVIDFTPFRHTDLTDAIRSAGFKIKDDSYQPGSPFYAVAATPRH
jgi:SAM-dependent methyltransferase